MLKRLLVPLDGSAVAEQAIPVAGRLARATGGKVVLVRVVSPPADADYGASLLQSASAELDPGVHLALKAARQYLEGAAFSSALTGANTEVVTTVGLAAAMIVSVARTRGIDLIVMVSQNSADVTRCALGSVAQTVTRHAPVPVLVLHHQPGPGDLFPANARPLRVLVPLNGSQLAEAAIAPAAHLAAALASPEQGTMHLVRVVNPDSPAGEVLDTTTKGRLLHQAQVYLASVAERLRQGIAAELKLAVTWSVTLHTDVARAIIQTAQDGEGAEGACRGSDLVALATHGRLGFQLLALGSVAERLLAETCLPVCIIRPEDAAGEQRMNQRRA